MLPALIEREGPASWESQLRGFSQEWQEKSSEGHGMPATPSTERAEISNLRAAVAERRQSPLSPDVETHPQTERTVDTEGVAVPDHHASIRQFPSIGPVGPPRWAVHCSCGVVETAPTWHEAVELLGGHVEEAERA